MGLCEMGLIMDVDVFNWRVEGKSTVRAFEKGIIPALLEKGIPLTEAVRRAVSDGLCKHENTVHNIIVTQSKVLVAMFLNNEVVTGLDYHAIGLGATNPLSSDTLLAIEVARKTITSMERSSTSIVLSTYYTAAQSTYNIKEGGIFCNGSSATLNSGTLFSHFLQSEDNSAGLNDLTFQYEFRIK